MMTLDEILEPGRVEKPDLIDELAGMAVDALSDDDRDHAIYSFRLLYEDDSVVNYFNQPLLDNCSPIHIDGNVWVPPPRARRPMGKTFRVLKR